MPVDAKDALTIMIGFGTLLVALLTLVLNIAVALISRKRK
jgi:hypothetical protein